MVPFGVIRPSGSVAVAPVNHTFPSMPVVMSNAAYFAAPGTGYRVSLFPGSRLSRSTLAPAPIHRLPSGPTVIAQYKVSQAWLAQGVEVLGTTWVTLAWTRASEPNGVIRPTPTLPPPE